MIQALLHQLVALLEPIGFVWFCLLALTIALWWRRQRGFAAVTFLLALFIWVIGSTPVPDRLLASLERPYAGVLPSELPAADAIVVLGAGACPSRYEAHGIHITSAGDRIVMGHALFKMGKAPVVVLGGNALDLDGRRVRECDIMRDLMLSWGMPSDALIPLGENRDTHDEAMKIHAMVQERAWKRILLVTSASHQQRASAAFRMQGLEIISVPCNFLSSVGLPTSPFRPNVPRHSGFVQMATWLHEKIGWLEYRRRGWIKDIP